MIFLPDSRFVALPFAVFATASALFGLSVLATLPANAESSHVPSHLELSRFPATVDPDARLFERDTAPKAKRKGFKVRKISILNYKQKLRMGNNDMVLRVRAPGKKKSIVTMELYF